MADGTKIEWTDATWNVVNGCTVVSPGCTNCYAMRLAGTRLKHHPSRAGLTVDSKAGPVWTGETRFNEAVLLDPLKWRRPRRIFVCAHGDLFHESVPDEWIDRVFAVMALAPQHTFQVLTKRAGRMREYLTEVGVSRRVLFDHAGEGRSWHICKWPLRNVWLGVSAEDQARADERIPHLLATPAAVRWVSAEPLLGPIDLTALDHERDRGWEEPMNALEPLLGEELEESWGEPCDDRPRLDWVAAGGESGPGARPMHPDWARSLRDQCASAGVPFLFKQWGEWAPVVDDDDIRFVRQWVLPPRVDPFSPGCARDDGGVLMHRPGKKAAGRLIDGQLHDGFPA